MELTEFLLARIAEDEAVARLHNERIPDRAPFVLASDDVETMRRFSPARVLAEVEAKRRIVAAHEMMPWRLATIGYVQGWDRYYEGGCCSRCTAGGEYGGAISRTDDGPMDYCETLLALAAIYSDHPDYDPAWRADA